MTHITNQTYPNSIPPSADNDSFTQHSTSDMADDWKHPKPKLGFFAQLLKAIRFQGKRFLRKSKPLLEAERTIELSNATVNGLIYENLVARFKWFQELETTLHEHDFTVHGTIKVKGVVATLTGKFEVVRYVFNDSTQEMVYRQIGETVIHQVEYPSLSYKLGGNIMLLYLKYIKKRDIFGYGLQQLSFVQVTPDPKQGDEITFNFARFIKPTSSIRPYLEKYHVNDAYILNHKLLLTTQLNLAGFSNNKDA